MQQALVGLILAFLEIADQVFGDHIFSHLTEETVGVIIAALWPLAIMVMQMFPHQWGSSHGERRSE